MGEVYLARDLALGRAVALKLLPAGFSDALKQRLLREGRASARLQHPAIATFYESAELDGQVFVAMEYVPGETLRARLARGALASGEAVQVASCLLEALAHAHAAGIIHRDIKPENVMITGPGTAKLLDFGLAKEWSDKEKNAATTVTAVTLPGALLGTFGYMSPEQLRGEPVGPRSDLFALGAVLYEALTGCPAFPGPTPAARMAAVFSTEFDAMSAPGVGPELGKVLSRALAREPEERYASAREFLADLRALGEGEASRGPDTLAILDLENISGDPADDWVGSGVAESLATDLSRVPGLALVAREKLLKARTMLAARGASPGPLDVGLALGCRWMLSGGFQKMGPALRITTRLTEVATGRAVSAEKFDGRMDDIFAMQDRLSEAVAASLRLALPDDAASTSSALKLEAYELYARGRRMFMRLEKGSLDQALELYEKVIAIEPKHVGALSGLSAVYAMRYPFTTDAADLDRAAGYARRAIEADPDLSDPHLWLGYVLFRQGRMEDAIAEERRALEIDPQSPWAPYFAGLVYHFTARPEKALTLYQTNLEADAQHGWSWLGLGIAHLDLGHEQEALWSLGKAVELEGPAGTHLTAGVRVYLGAALCHLGRLAAAREECLQGLTDVESSDHMYRDTFRALGLCVLGRTTLLQGDRAAARTAFDQALSHLRGRSRALGGGYLVVQALAGIVQAGGNVAHLDEACDLFERRQGFDFSLLWLCTDGVTLVELARAAQAAGRAEEARALLDRAVAAGSTQPGDL